MLQMLLLIAAGLAAFFYFCIVKPLRYWKDRGVNQASVFNLLKNNYNFFSKKVSLAEASVIGYHLFPNSRYVGGYQFTKPILSIRDPNLIKDITVKSFDHFMDHTNTIPENADPLWAKNLVALRGQKWRDMRSVLSPSFTSSKMKVMYTLMVDCAQNFSKYFSQQNEEVIEIEMKDIFTRFTNDVIATTAFGIKTDSLKDKNNEFYSMGAEIANFQSFSKLLKFMVMAVFPKLSGMLQLSFFDKRMKNFFINLIDNTIKVREEKGIVRPDMIHLLMEARKGIHTKEETPVIDEGFATAKEADITSEKGIQSEITNIDITAQAVIFFLAGFETVSSTMCFVGYELAANPDYQKKLREEILETLDRCQGNLTYEALLKMKYMDMFVTESLRKWPVALLTERQCTKTYTIQPENPGEKALVLEKGSTVWLPVYPIHHDPKYYPEPEKFDPERFSDENKSNIKPYTYFPFGLGPRNCIGSRFALLEIKVVYFYLLKDFEIVPIAKSQIPIKISKKKFNLTSEGGFWFGLKRLRT